MEAPAQSWHLTQFLVTRFYNRHSQQERGSVWKGYGSSLVDFEWHAWRMVFSQLS